MTGRMFLALVRAGFRRWSTYRQAALAAAFTNTVFGFLRLYVLLAVAAGAGGVVAGYDGPMLASYVWLGQGLIGVVSLWGWTELADRVRTGEIGADLLRPVDPVWTYLATDLGRAGHAMLVRFVLPLLVGALAFDLYTPRNLPSYPLFACSVLLAVVVCFAGRYLMNLTAFWLLDIRGVNTLWIFGAPMLSGLVFPIRFLPEWLQYVLWYGTPFPAMLQAPLDVFLERGDPAGLVANQVAWAAVTLTACHLVQRTAVRKLVIQGG